MKNTYIGLEIERYRGQMKQKRFKNLKDLIKEIFKFKIKGVNGVFLIEYKKYYFRIPSLQFSQDNKKQPFSTYKDYRVFILLKIKEINKIINNKFVN